MSCYLNKRVLTLDCLKAIRFLFAVSCSMLYCCAMFPLVELFVCFVGLNLLPMPSAWVPTWESRGENSTAIVENYKVRRGERRRKWGGQNTPKQLDWRSENEWEDGEMKGRWWSRMCEKYWPKSEKRKEQSDREGNTLGRVWCVCWIKQERKEQLEHRAKVEVG